MSLIGITGNARTVNTQLLIYALKNTPAFIIDCANCANPHAFFPYHDAFDKVFVLEIELIYVLRDVVKQLNHLIKDINPKCIIITTFHRLFHYQNEQENNDLYIHMWELLQEHAQRYSIFIGIAPMHKKYAHYCDRIKEVNEWVTQSGVNAW